MNKFSLTVSSDIMECFDSLTYIIMEIMKTTHPNKYITNLVFLEMYERVIVCALLNFFIISSLSAQE